MVGNGDTPQGLSVGIESTLAGAIFDAAVDSILVTDDRGLILAANRAALQAFGFSERELLGHNVSCLMPESHARAHDGYMENYCRTGERKIIGIGREVTGQRKDGSCFPLHLSIGEFFLGGRRLFVGICHDISERHRFVERVAFLAAYDSLTGCLNRHQFLLALDTSIQACKVSGAQLAVLFIDLDGFKQVNDTHGHMVGDRLLRQVAERFQGELRDEDRLGRVGGDEFVVSMIFEPAADIAEKVAVRLIESLKEPFVMDGTAVMVAASIGISLYPQYGQTADELLNEADIAMYQAKLSVDERIRRFDLALRERSERVYRLLERLRKALALEQFELHYQLQFDMHTLQPCGMEALLRWRDGGRVVVAPDEFIPVAQEYGLMPDIGRWVIERACRDNAALIAAGLLDVTVAVNVCAPLFSENDFVDLVQRALRDSGLPARRLELEITESVAMNDSNQILHTSEALHLGGIRLAMDDFGVGFSSLGRLKSLRFDKLKIDRSFVAGLPDQASDRAIVQAIIGIAKGLDMRTVAEGVETEEQLAYLRAEGCQQGQGFWFSRPMPLAALIERLRASPRGSGGDRRFVT